MPVPFTHPADHIRGWKEEILWVRATEFPRKYRFNLIMNVWYSDVFQGKDYRRHAQQFVMAKMNGKVFLWFQGDWDNGRGADRKIEVPAKFFDMNESAEEMADELKQWLEDNFCRVTPGWETVLTGMS